MVVKKSFFIIFSVAYTLVFSTITPSNIHLSDLLFDLKTLCQNDYYNLRTPQTNHNHHIITEKIKSFTRSVETLFEKTDKKTYQTVFKQLAFFISSDKTDEQEILKDLLEFYSLKQTKTNSFRILMTIVENIEEYSACLDDTTNINFYELTNSILEKLEHTTNEIKSQTFPAKKKKKKSLLKKRYLNYLLSFFSITLVIIVGTALYKKIKKNLAQSIKHAEQLAVEQRTALQQTNQQLQQAINKKHKESIHTLQKNKNLIDNLAKQQTEQLQKTNQQIQQTLQKNKSLINDLAKQQKEQLEKTAQQLQQITTQNKNHADTLAQRQQENLQQTNQTLLERIEQNQQALQRLSTTTQNQSRESVRLTERIENIQQTGTDQTGMITILTQQINKLKQEQTKLRRDLVQTFQERNRIYASILREQENDTSIIRSLGELGQGIVEYITNTPASNSNQNQQQNSFANLLEQRNDLELASLRVPTENPA